MFALSPVNFTPIAFPIPQTSSTAISSLPCKTTQLRQSVFSNFLGVTDELESPRRLRTLYIIKTQPLNLGD